MDITEIQRKTIKLLTSAIFHHPNAAFEMLSLPRTYGGRGLIDINNLLNKQKKLYLKSALSKDELHFYYKVQYQMQIKITHHLIYLEKAHLQLQLTGKSG
jgi:hypothetical protein